MKKDKKYWFLKMSRTLWIPISWEGWGALFVFVGALMLIYKGNDVSDEVTFDLASHWPMLLEMGVSIMAFYWVSHGHVKK